jgi:hypothetical protein
VEKLVADLELENPWERVVNLVDMQVTYLSREREKHDMDKEEGEEEIDIGRGST